MAFFTADQITELSRTTVRVATLVAFHYDPVIRFWNGNRTLSAGGYEWNGLGGLGQIDGLMESRSGESSQVRFTLTGTNAEINAIAMSQGADQTGKLAIVAFQLMNDDWQPVGSPIPVWTGVTQPMSASSVAAPEGQGRQRSITLAAENLFYGRSRPRAGMFTDRDQKQRYPGDKFFEFQSQLKNMTYVWP